MTSAVKRGGFMLVMRTLQTYRINELADVEDANRDGQIIASLPVENGQIGYQIGVASRDQEVNFPELYKDDGIICGIVPAGRFILIIFITQTHLPMTINGFTQCVATLRPEELEHSDAEKMRIMMTGFDSEMLSSKFLVGYFSLQYMLCEKVLNGVNNGGIIWNNLKAASKNFEAAKRMAFSKLELGGETSGIDPNAGHEISAISYEDLKVRY